MADYGMLQQAVKSNYGSKDGLEEEKRFVMDEDNYSKLDPPNASSALVVNARVTVKGFTSQGTIRFAGPHATSGKLRIGVELDTAEGKNDGTVKGHEYFKCKSKHGLLVIESKVSLIPGAVRYSTYGFETDDENDTDTSYGYAATYENDDPSIARDRAYSAVDPTTKIRRPKPETTEEDGGFEGFDGVDDEGVFAGEDAMRDVKVAADDSELRPDSSYVAVDKDDEMNGFNSVDESDDEDETPPSSETTSPKQDDDDGHQPVYKQHRSPTGDSIKEFKEDSKDANKPHTYINGSTTENMSDTSKHTYINDINDTNDTNETENKTDVTVAADGYSTLAEIITQESKGHHQQQQQSTTCQPPPPQYSLPPVSSPLPPSTTSTMSASDGIIVKNEQYATLPLTLTPPPVVSIQTQPLPDNQSDTSINQSDTSINQSDILIQPNPEYDHPSLILQSTPSSTTTVGDVAYMLLPTKSQSQKQQELYDIRKSLSTISKAKEPVFTLPTPTPGTPIITSTVIDRSADEIQAFTYDSLDSNIDADAGLRDSDPGQWNGDLSM